MNLKLNSLKFKSCDIPNKTYLKPAHERTFPSEKELFLRIKYSLVSWSFRFRLVILGCYLGNVILYSSFSRANVVAIKVARYSFQTIKLSLLNTF